MSKIIHPLIFLLCCVISVRAQNTVSFDNQSGEPALVKLIGPTSSDIEVPNGSKQALQASAGKYFIKVRYGSQGNYHYTKGQEFTVDETATTTSDITITLHKVVHGNYGSSPISEQEFGFDNGSTLRPRNDIKRWEEDTNAHALILVARQLSTEARYEEAVSNCDAVIKIQSNHILAYCVKGQALNDLERWREAIDAFNAALKLDQSCVIAITFKAIALKNMGRVEESRSLLDEVFKIEPKNNDAFDCYSRGCAFHARENYSEALESYTRSLKIDSNNAEAYYNRGMAYQMLNEDAKAIDDYTKAVTLNPRYAVAYNELGSMLGMRKRFDLALGNYSKAIEINSNFAIAYSNRGLLFAARPGPDFSAAKRDWQRAVELSPTSIAGRRAQELLGRLPK
jgi:tetratricopeptide (TPR) repeat protein